MKSCPNCRNQVDDGAVYCPVCGTAIDAIPHIAPQQSSAPTTDYNPNYTQPPVCAPSVPYVDPYDHTADFDAADISETKIFALAMYLLGPLGIIIALLGAKESRYTTFHVRQSLKLTVAEILGLIFLTIAAFLMWNLRMRTLMLFVVTAALIGLVVLRLLCVLQIVKNKAKEVYIVRNLQFLK